MFTLASSRATIGGTSDEFHFVYQTLSADGEIIARVGSLTNVNGNLAGVMMRKTLNPGSEFASTLIKSGGSVKAIYRTSLNASSSNASGNTPTLPFWVKVKRVGTSYSMWQSADSGGSPSGWTRVGSSITISPMTGSVYMGLVVSSAADGALATSTFTSVTVTGAATPTPSSTPTSTPSPTPTPGATPTPTPSSNLAYLGLFTGSKSSSSSSVSTSSVVTAAVNNLYIAVMNSNGPSKIVNTSSINGICSTWTKIASRSISSKYFNLEVYRCFNSTSTTNAIVKANLDASADRAVIAVYRFSGANSTTPIGNYAIAAAGSATNNPSATLNVSTVNSFSFGAIGTGRRSISTAGTGYILTSPNPNIRVYTSSDETSVGITSEYKKVTAIGNTSVSTTLSGNAWWSIIAIEIKD